MVASAATGLRGSGLIMLSHPIEFVTCVILLSAPLQELSRSLGYVSVLGAVLERCGEVLDVAPEEVDRAHGEELPPLKGAIRFDHVHFSHGPGQTVVIIGPSGAGKSTLLDLLPRFLEASAGRILLDGHEIARCRLGGLRHQIALVAQEPILFDGTLLENLLFARPEASMEQVRRAAVGTQSRNSPSGCPGATRPRWARAASTCRSANASASPSRGHCSRTPAS